MGETVKVTYGRRVAGEKVFESNKLQNRIFSLPESVLSWIQVMAGGLYER